MPGFDGTGPRGLGPMTGWRRGYCLEPADYVHPRSGIFGGYWGGRGRGWRNRYWATGVPGRAWWGMPTRFEPEMTNQEEMKILQEEAKILERQLEYVKKDIDKLKQSKTEEKK
jgi:hypothetical protein